MKTRDIQWYDLFGTRPTRRDFLRVGGGAAGLLALGALPGCERRLRLGADPFSWGVASGDPSADGVVLWSRLAADVLEASGVHRDVVAVRWEVAEDDAFTQVVRSAVGSATPELGHSVHVEVDGLEPAREYYYRVVAGDVVSPVGRTRTAPRVGAPVDRFRFAFASCQQYEHGYYTAYRHMAGEELDLIVHLGDYIYERTWGENLVRHHEGPEIHTLDDYRARYATYRSDPDLQAAHASAPWVVTWDDHEVDNNYAGDVAEDDQTREQLLLRRAAAYQAFYEFMPLRRSSMPAGPDLGLYRRLDFGSLLSMFVLDTRQYRSDQACGDGRKATCPEHTSPERTLLGSEQRSWLFEGLAGTEATWNVLAQQILLSRLRGEDESGQETWAMDMWDGYPADRQALVDLLAERATPNPVVLTGDIHSNWVADVKRDFDDASSPTVATELVGTSISSGGDGSDTTAGGEAALAANPHIKFYNGQRGYVVVALTAERLTSENRVVPFVRRPGSDVQTRATWVVESGRAGAERA